MSSEAPPPSSRITKIPADVYVIPVCAASAGSALGFLRGSRMASLRFLAENAHRPPTTLQGWYFYNKTKNYRVLLGGFKGGGKEALKLGAFGSVWVAFEQGYVWAVDSWPWTKETGRWKERTKVLKDVVAGVGTACVVSGIYALPRRTAIRTVGLGLGVGVTMSGLRQLRDYLERELKTEPE